MGFAYIILRKEDEDRYVWDDKYSRIFWDNDHAIRYYHQVVTSDEVRGNALLTGIPRYVVAQTWNFEYYDNEIIQHTPFKIISPPYAFSDGDKFIVGL